MFCLSGFIQFDGIGEKPCAEHHELNICMYLIWLIAKIQTGLNLLKEPLSLLIRKTSLRARSLDCISIYHKIR